MDQVNERTSSRVTVGFFDEDDLPVVPSSGSYRIDDEASRSAIVGMCAFASLASSGIINITPAQNRILDEANHHEDRLITVSFGYGTGQQGTDEHRYRIINLYGVTT
jgi:hypothetical protein